ncbi:MAG TPA: GntR family transcriptional regulator [Hyphomicrobiales bacterium]|jgi:DNA-binding GntR family transcriptional regulator
MKIKQANYFRDRIEDEIATGHLKPGERLEEMSLAQRFGVSRTPVRETLQQLAATGLVELRGRRGAIVSAPDPARLLEMFDVMAELEALCGRLAARRATAEDEAALRATLASCREAAESGDSDVYYYENERFHRAVYAASGNRFLAEQASSVNKRLAPFRRLQLRVRNRMRTSYDEHAAIVDAILSGNGALAAERLHSHVSVQGERFSDLISTLDRTKSRTG